MPLSPGDKIHFGGHDWIVLDKQQDAALLIAKDIMERRYYHHEGHAREERLDQKVTWDESDLRKYLNGAFYNRFNEADKANIITVTNKNLGSPYTHDNIFILSLDEFEVYYPSKRRVKYGGKYSAFWLRSPGHCDYHAVYVNANGCVKPGGDRFNRIYGVRPALWLKSQG